MYKVQSIELVNITTHKHTKYEFRQGVPTLIIGKNEDDPSQKGNGSGKSGFMEGVAIAVTGSPVRDASNKEMVRRGCDFGEVTLKLYNTIYSCELTIWRRLSTTESLQVKVWENGEQIVKSDVNEYNKLIFEYLAISKEDFFNFYLLTQATYTPFFRVGDVKKKEIVNRFSGADKLDAVKAFIDQDVAEATLVVDAIQKKLSVNSGKQELLSQQIEEEEAKFSEESKAKAIEAKELEASQQLDLIETNEALIKEYESHINRLEDDIQNWNVNYQEQIDKLIPQKEDLNAKLTLLREEYKSVPLLFKDQKATIASQKAHIQDSIDGYRSDIKEMETLEAEIEKQLHGTIECPKCHHKFFIKGQDLTWEEATEKLKETKELISELKAALEEERENEKEALVEEEQLKVSISEAQEAKRIEGVRVGEQLSELEDQISKLKANKNDQELNIKKAKGDIESLKQKLQNLHNANKAALVIAEKLDEEIANITEGTSELVSSLEQALLRAVDEATEIEEQLQVAMDVVKSKEEWHTNFKQFKSFLANQSIKTIEDYTNMFLQKMGTNLSVSIEGYKTLANKKLKEQITITVLRNGIEDASYGTFSGGERARIDVAVILAIQSLINLNSTSGGIDLLFIDEVMDSVDSLGMQHIMEGLKNVGRTVCIVSQVEINALGEDTLIIEKRNQISKIL